MGSPPPRSGWGHDPVVSAQVDADTAYMNLVAQSHMTPRLAEIKRLVALGEYKVDPYEIADAMIRRAEREIETARRFDPQKECSYPESSPSASVKTAAGRPSTTPPIQLRAAVPVGQAA